MKAEEIREAVRKRYATAATKATGCCSEASCGEDVIGRDLYSAGDLAEVPRRASDVSLGCGNPTALAELHPGEVVLDLGSGGGIDVLLSARRVGPEGKAYGLDMTDEMLELARKNQREAGVTNVEFLKGHIEAIPLPDESVDVVISNCVINLSVDKDRVLQEAFRVLRPGGRFAVTDIVVRGSIPAAVRRSLELWSGCVAGALEEGQYRAKLEGAGFEDVGIEVVRVYDSDVVRELAGELEGLEDLIAATEGGRFISAFVRGHKPEVS